MKPTLIILLGISSLLPAGAKEADLIRLYEEEILAHDLYVELGKTHPGIMPFQKIPSSEAQHREVMAGILKEKGIALPEPAAGKRFVTKDLNKTYKKWLREGRQSELAACRVGVRLEEFDIADLRKAKQDSPEYKDSFAALEAASNNHLRAFHRNLTNRGGEYTPESLPQNDFKKIVNSAQQPGACNCDGVCNQEPKGNRQDKAKGRGQRNGQGQGNGPRQGRGKGQGNGPRGQGGPNR
jgi:hypothetical protein